MTSRYDRLTNRRLTPSDARRGVIMIVLILVSDSERTVRELLKQLAKRVRGPEPSTLTGILRSRFAAFATSCGREHQALHRFGQRHSIVDGSDFAASRIQDQVMTAARGRQDWQSGRHRFQDGVRHPFGPRWHQEEIVLGQQLLNLRP